MHGTLVTVRRHITLVRAIGTRLAQDRLIQARK